MRTDAVISEFQVQRAIVSDEAKPIALKGSLKCFHGVQLKAAKLNDAAIFVGSDAQVATNGFKLQSEELVFIPVDCPEKIWAVTEPDADPQELYFILS